MLYNFKDDNIPFVNIKEYKKKILKQGMFKEFCVCAYNMFPTPYCGIIVFSDKVDECTILKHHKKTIALIFPYEEDIINFLKKNSNLIKKIIKVDCPYVTVYDMKKNPICQTNI